MIDTDPAVPAAVSIGAGELVLLGFAHKTALMTISKHPCGFGVKTAETDLRLLSDLIPLFCTLG